MKRKCKMCQNIIVGRSDKIFCSVHCKSEYHFKLRKVTAIEVREINKILARNRSILLELMGKNSVQKKIKRLELDRKKFNFKYHTHLYTKTPPLGTWSSLLLLNMRMRGARGRDWRLSGLLTSAVGDSMPIAKLMPSLSANV